MTDWWSAAPAVEGGRGATIVNSDAPTKITIRPLGKYGEAISSVESGGRYDALGPVTRTGDRAYGKYQVMGSNIGPWTQEVFGQPLSVQEFLANPQAQDAVFNAKFGQYLEKTGSPQDAASMWFTGKPFAAGANLRDQLGMSGADYVNKFTSALGFSSDTGKQNGTSLRMAADEQGDWWSAAPVIGQMKQPDNAPAQLSPTATTPLPQGFDEAGFKPDVGQFNAFLSGARQGVTANFGDELSGVSAAAGMPGINVAGIDTGTLIGLARLGYEYFTGQKGEATAAYERARDAARAQTAAAQEQYPITTTAGEFAGAVALPVGPTLNAATMPARIGRGAAVGATYGGLAGAGQAETPGQIAPQAATGAALGTAAGAVAPMAVKGVELAGAGIAKAVRPFTSAVNPEKEAARRVTGALATDIGAGNAGLAPGEFAAARSAGMPVSVMDLGGEMTRAVARSAANTSPEGRGILNRVIDARYEGQSSRVTDWLQRNFNYPNAFDQQLAIDKLEKLVNKPAYDKAFAQGRKGIFDKELFDLSQAPMMQDAIKAATVTAQNRSAPDIGKGQAAIAARWARDGKPTLEFWDLVKRQIDQEINVAKRAGRSADVMEATRIKELLVNKLDSAVPVYSTARAGAARFFGAENALEAGQNFVTSKMTNREARDVLAKMTPTERQLFQDGFVSRYVEYLNSIGDRRNILNQIAQNPNAREKLYIALGRQKADELETVLRVEGIMDLARGAIQGNSTTARQLVEAGLAGGVQFGAGAGIYGMMTGNFDSRTILIGALTAGAGRLGKKIDVRVSTKVAEMLVSPDPATMQRALQMVSRNHTMLKNLRAADAAIAKISSREAQGLPMIQAPGIGAAQDQQNIPGPPSQ